MCLFVFVSLLVCSCWNEECLHMFLLDVLVVLVVVVSVVERFAWQQPFESALASASLH